MPLLRRCLTVALLLLASGVLAQQSTNHVLHAVPPPKPVVVDGQLDEWDLSGQFECFASLRQRHRYSVKVAAMWDADFLYLGLQWRDPTPMHNMVDSRFDPGSGWRSDCLQLRVRTDLTMHVDAWYSTAAGQPVCTVAYGRFSNGRDPEEDVGRFQDRTDILAAGGKQAFRLGEDGKSYTQELALPWASLTGHAAVVKTTGQPFRPPRSFAAGDSFRLGMEFLWGQPDGKTFPMHRYADLLDEEHSDREFFWTAERAWGTVRLEPAGQLQLPQPDYAGADTQAQPTAGPIDLAYELPATGFATLVIDDAAGNRVRNLIGMAPREAGRQLEHWDGTDEQGRLVAPGTYRWRGLTHQGIDPVYLASYGSPGQPAWDTADGKGAWMSDHNAPTAVAAGGPGMILAADGSEAGWAMIGVTIEGRKVWGERKFQGIVALDADETHVYAAMNGHGEPPPPPTIGRCLAADAAYAPFATAPEPQLLVPVLRAGETGRIAGLAVVGDRLAVSLAGPDVVRFFHKVTAAPLGEVAVPAPGGLDAAPDGTLCIVSGATVVKLTDGQLTPFITGGLGQPGDLAVAADGSVYVTDLATHQVKVFDRAGAHLRDLGVAGGRPQPGRWVAGGLRSPSGLDFDAQGRLWVAERDKTPKRVSVWTAAGELVRDYLGPTGYGGMGAFADPADRQRLFGSSCEWRVDFAANTATVVANSLPDLDAGELLRHDGREYVMAKRQALYLRRGDVFVICAKFGWVAEPTVEAVRDADNRARAVHNFLWSDGNEDGEIQLDECVFEPIENHPRWDTGYWGGYWLDEAFNLVCVPGSYGRLQAFRFPRTGWTPGGVPKWDTANRQLLFDQPLPGGPSNLLLARQDLVIVSYTPITAIRPDGTVAWTYANPWNNVHGSHKSPIPAHDGMLIGILSCIGQAASPVGPLFAMNSNMGRLYLMTTDGLLVASVFQDCRTGPDAWPDTAAAGAPLHGVTMGGEWFGGYFFRAERENEYYLIAGGTSYNAIRLDGLDKVRPLPGGTIEVTPAHLAAAELLQQQRAAAATTARELTVARLEAPPQVDGKPTEFPAEAWVAWSAGENRMRAAVAVAGDRLCLAWEVNGDRHPMVNGGKDLNQLFITGDSVDLQLATDPAADPRRQGAAPGDLRLLITEFAGQPVAVLYRYRLPGAGTPVTFSSPWRQYVVDSVQALPNAAIAIQRQGQRYVVEATVPLSDLGFAPAAGQLYKLDLGVIFSDATGTNRASRAYWANQATGLVNDVPGEIMPAPSLWGTARFP